MKKWNLEVIHSHTEFGVGILARLFAKQFNIPLVHTYHTLYEDIVDDAAIVIWNGPLGVYEFEKYKKHTNDLLDYIVTNNIKAILGGGDIVAAATTAGYKEKVYHASTGGGATLEYLEGKTLPGLEAIK